MSTAQALKLELIEWLANVHDQSLIQELAQWKEDHERITIEQYNKELDEADAEMDRGEFISHQDLKAQMKNW